MKKYGKKISVKFPKKWLSSFVLNLSSSLKWSPLRPLSENYYVLKKRINLQRSAFIRTNLCGLNFDPSKSVSNDKISKKLKLILRFLSNAWNLAPFYRQMLMVDFYLHLFISMKKRPATINTRVLISLENVPS